MRIVFEEESVNDIPTELECFVTDIWKFEILIFYNSECVANIYLSRVEAKAFLKHAESILNDPF